MGPLIDIASPFEKKNGRPEQFFDHSKLSSCWNENGGHFSQADVGLEVKGKYKNVRCHKNHVRNEWLS